MTATGVRTVAELLPDAFGNGDLENVTPPQQH
jgi:hypothetical protein